MQGQPSPMPNPHLRQGQGMTGDLVHKATLLGRRGKVDAALQHAAAVAVRGDVHRVRSGRVVHKLAVLGPQTLQAALDDVIAVQVADERHHSPAQRISHQCHLEPPAGLSSELGQDAGRPVDSKLIHWQGLLHVQ